MLVSKKFSPSRRKVAKKIVSEAMFAGNAVFTLCAGGVATCSSCVPCCSSRASTPRCSVFVFPSLISLKIWLKKLKANKRKIEKELQKMSDKLCVQDKRPIWSNKFKY